ncbi:MAG TPA: hypothetical protein DF712_06725 [Balneola sp.]|nr:hypothetical protein [Balneola sp.]|tara:strand:+ start:1842 stop:2243 length:402 start_codon:yes stop_codon:yes gene_type:complete
MPANSWRVPPGINNVGSYQVSGYPYITGSNALTSGSEHKISFPKVTRSIIVMNHSSNTLRFSFAPTGSNDKRVQDGFHYVELDSDEDSMQLNVKCKEIYISSTAGTVEYRVIAELTNIDTNSMGPISGSGISD